MELGTKNAVVGYVNELYTLDFLSSWFHLKDDLTISMHL